MERNRLLVAASAPLLVVLALRELGSAPLVFAAYHVGLCLLVPWLASRREGLSVAAHLRTLGLERRGLQLGLGLALASALIPPLAWLQWPGLFPDAARLREALDGWGLAVRSPGTFLFFLAIVNGPAEELFWRGWLLRSTGDGRRPGAASRLAFALLFTSYHAVTIGRLAPTPAAAALMLGAVLAGALAWNWSRARWGSVWPALLSHTGASCGYLFVCARLLESA